MSSREPIDFYYLVFDDEDEEENQNKLLVKAAGLRCHVIFVNPQKFYNPENDTFDFDGFKNEIKSKTYGHPINFIATDWNMLHKTKNFPEVNGLEVIEFLVKIDEKKYRKCQYLIYSGKPLEASRILVSKLKEEICVEEIKEPIYSLQVLSLIMELKIKFCARAARFNEINTLIKGEKTISLVVQNVLANFSHTYLINTGNDAYDGKTIEYFVNELSQDNDQGLKFVRELIELSIANYTEINE